MSAEADAAVIVEAALRVVTSGGTADDLAEMLAAKYGEQDALKMLSALVLAYTTQALDAADDDD